MEHTNVSNAVGASKPDGGSGFVSTTPQSLNSSDSGHITDGPMWDAHGSETIGEVKAAISAVQTRAMSAKTGSVVQAGGKGNGARTDGNAIPQNPGSEEANDESNPPTGSTSHKDKDGDSRSSGTGRNNPHRSVGGGSDTGSPLAGQGQATLLAKMFVEPLTNPVPLGANFLPCGTEEVTTEREIKGNTYSPVMWADPLLPVNVTIGTTHTKIDKLPATGCSVNNLYDAVEPQYTPLGVMLKALLDTESNPTILRAMLPVRGTADLGAVVALAEVSRRIGPQCLTDEAPLIRLGLLMHLLAPAQWMGYTTSVVQNVCCNGYVDPSKVTKTWTDCPANSTSTLIGTAKKSSTIYWRTVAQYSRLINGSHFPSDLIKSGETNIDWTQIKFIPVKMAWRGCQWLGAYILAHTTTQWWNHAIDISIPVSIHDIKTTSNSLTVHCLPKASTVYIPGLYKYICLVIVDAADGSLPETSDFYIGNTYKATYGGNEDFAKIAYKLIGRSTEQPAIALTMSDCYKAWRVMCSGLLSHIRPQSIEVKLSVLATSRFNGFAVWTDESKQKVEVSDYASLLSDLNMTVEDAPHDIHGWMDYLTLAQEKLTLSLQEGASMSEEESDVDHAQVLELVKTAMAAMFGPRATKEIDHVGGVTCADPKVDIKIGDHTVPDWFTTYSTTEKAPDRVKLYTWWRVDALHRSQQGLIKCEDGSKPKLDSFVAGEIQYNIKECSDLTRMLSYCGIYKDNESCPCLIKEPVDVINRSLGYGSLLLAMVEMWRLESGLALPDYNGLSKSTNLVDDQTVSIVSSLTNGFMTDSMNTSAVAWTSDLDLKNVVKKMLGVEDPDWIDHWYGGVVPWWYVQAVYQKFGGETVVKTTGNTSVRLDFDNQWADEQGYHIRLGSSLPTDLAVVSSSISYEFKVRRKCNPYFTIMTPNRDAHKMAVHWTSWYYNELNDRSKPGIRGMLHVAKPDYEGIVELNSITYPCARVYKGYAHPEAFVGADNRWSGVSDYSIRGGLLWPDPMLDWLKQGLVEITPHLLRMDVVGAVGAGLGHLNKTILDWLNEKIHGDKSFRD